MVQFSIDKEGKITDVKALSFTGNCRACTAEAVNVFTSAPAWQPAIQNNVAVMYRQKQKVIFQVAEGKRNAKG